MREVEMIAYKVVERGTRWCSNWALFKQYLLDDGTPEEYVRGVRFRKEHPELFPRYHKGSIVKAAIGSVGIMCFPSERHAESFKGYSRRLSHSLMIIRVEGIGKPRQPTSVIARCGKCPWNLAEMSQVETSRFRDDVEKGSIITFPTVRVLD